MSGRTARVAGVVLLLLLLLGFSSAWVARRQSFAKDGGPMPRRMPGEGGAPGSGDVGEVLPRKIQERRPEVHAPERVTYRQQLEHITVPVIEFDDTSLEEALDFLRLRTREADPPVPQSGGFVVKLPADFVAPHMTLSMKGATSSEVLEKIAEMAGVKLWITGDFVILLMPGAPEPVLGKMAKSATWDRAAAAGIPVVAYDGEVSLREAVDDLNGRELDGPRVVIGAGVDDSLKVGGMSLRNVPLSDVVQLLVAGTKNRVTVEGEEIRIVAAGRWWMVDGGWWMVDGGWWMVDGFLIFHDEDSSVKRFAPGVRAARDRAGGGGSGDPGGRHQHQAAWAGVGDEDVPRSAGGLHRGEP
ncbi:MAG: hypothetical protein JWO82_3202 [Akkermansiaceae bacterium]|nr:hypothetical protein [Akkermansiaceae bacterium]